jgi:uncharacterized protein GlcG (DUF336 family)
MSTTTAIVPLTIKDAETLVTAARSAAEDAGVTVSVTALDACGHLLAFRRDDRAVSISGETSTRKAYTALQLNAATTDLVNAVQSRDLFHTLPTALDRPLLFIVGGVPVHRDGRLIGAIGVGGSVPSRTTPSPQLPWRTSSEDVVSARSPVPDASAATGVARPRASARHISGSRRDGPWQPALRVNQPPPSVERTVVASPPAAPRSRMSSPR